MGYAYCAFSFINVLTTCTLRTEYIYPQIFFINLYINIFRFWHYGYSCR